LSWNDAAAHAIQLAESGFVVDDQHAHAFARAAAEMDPISRRALFPEGVPTAGRSWKQPDLAYRRLGNEGRAPFIQVTSRRRSPVRSRPTEGYCPNRTYGSMRR
jgi:gamma-glutamyltranspeptidase